MHNIVQHHAMKKNSPDTEYRCKFDLLRVLLTANGTAKGASLISVQEISTLRGMGDTAAGPRRHAATICAHIVQFWVN